MVKKLIRTGDGLALVLDAALLERTGIDADTRVEVSTDGDVIIISPVRTAKCTARLKDVMDRANEHYTGAFKRLAE